MAKVVALWWDDQNNSTHLHPAPFPTKKSARDFARTLPAKVINPVVVRPDDVKFFFPS